MSEQADTDDSTSLEEVFNSREFGRVAGVEEVVVTKEFGVATRFVAPVLGNAVVGLSDPPFEDVLHSARAGRSLTLVPPLPAGAPVGIAMPAEDAAVTPLDPRRPERNRYRAVAAVSGIAAAALVVAGITSGTVQQRPSEVSALGARVSSGAGSASRRANADGDSERCSGGRCGVRCSRWRFAAPCGQRFRRARDPERARNDQWGSGSLAHGGLGRCPNGRRWNAGLPTTASGKRQPRDAGDDSCGEQRGRGRNVGDGGGRPTRQLRPVDRTDRQWGGHCHGRHRPDGRFDNRMTTG